MSKDDDDVDELIRRRMEEEQKIMESTRQRRKLKMRQLIGDQAEGVGDRKDHIDDAKRLWSNKGTTEEDKQNSREHYGTGTIGMSALQKAKQQYQENLQAFSQKGKSEDHREAGDSVPALENLKLNYDKPKQKLPSFLAQKQEDYKESTKPTSGAKEAGAAVGFGDEFETIEKEEITMVGLEKHVTITGISKAGRRVTRTKIILPKVVGETQHQGQETPKFEGEPNNPLLPSNFDGKYYSLDAILHRSISNYDSVIDKNNREQYLSPDEFNTVFGMTKDEFAKLPKWKRVNKKRGLQLY